jgi:hypothetical protein
MWKQHDNYMRQLKQLYNKTSKQTQNRLQELFDTFNFTSENVYDIANNKTKKRINTYIEQWKEQGLLKNNNYFTVLANNIYKRTRVKNSEILELLIYSAYIEEQSKLEEPEKQIMYKDTNYYYEEGQKEVNKKKKPSIIPMALFLALLDQPNYSGFNWKQYIEATIQYNAQQIYKKAILNMQQQKGLEIDSNEFQTIINRQNNQKLNVNGNKISGAADLQMIGLNNLAKVEGIKEVAEDNSKVRFIAVEDDKTTLMCDSLNNQEFYINKENVFDRYYGETQKELTIQRIRCNGLVLGLNLPPIQHHFHYCRSTIMYLPPVEKQEKTRYNIAEYVRKNKITDSRTIDEKIKRVKRKFPAYIQEYINNTPVEIIGKGKNNHYLDGKLYLLNDATEEEIIHEIGHIIEEKLNIANDEKYQTILKSSIGEIDVFNNSIGPMRGYDADKYEFLLSGDKFISDYQRRVYNIDINKNNRIDYLHGTFNYNVFRDYLPEGLRCYMIDKNLLKTKNIELYKYIKEVLHERK